MQGVLKTLTSTTTTLATHLRSHPDLHKDYQEKRDARERPSKLKGASKASGQQPSIADSFKPKMRASAPKAQQMTKMIARSIDRGMHPYNIVEEPGFLDMMKFAMPDYAVPSRTTFSRAIIPNLYASSKEKVKKKLGDIFSSGVELLSITTDGWTSRANDSYVCVTCDVMDSDFVQHSAKARGRLQEIQRNMQLDPLEVIQDVPTRWNSEHARMARLVKLRTVITVELSESDAVPNLNASEWKLMNAAVQVLKPLDHATTELPGDRYPTLSQVIPLLQCIEVVLAEHVSEGGEAALLASSLLHSIKTRFPDIKMSRLPALAMLVDPRYKDVCYAERPAKQWAFTLLAMAAEETVPVDQHGTATSETNTCSADPSGDSPLMVRVSSPSKCCGQKGATTKEVGPLAVVLVLCLSQAIPGHVAAFLLGYFVQQAGQDELTLGPLPPAQGLTVTAPAREKKKEYKSSEHHSKIVSAKQLQELHMS
ncbi:hypothetical protein HPB49_006505 [Dermacentor silvarum]|uniref:Uncharacterized protein n=1 Tax=Dermacentor silvarum TaxID=543639 RepID=A0ACB8C7X1_DERSI|nr:hypothetical protein HPB49_006505 [Dermacentor silvarum]